MKTVDPGSPSRRDRLLSTSNSMDEQPLWTGVVALLGNDAFALLLRPLLLRTFDVEGTQSAGYRIIPLDFAVYMLIALAVAL